VVSSDVALEGSKNLMEPPTEVSDFSIHDGGSLVLLYPLNDSALNWVENNIGENNGFQPYYPQAIVIERRYLADIVSGIFADGLSIG
jgi:hypothetical protein